MEPLIGFLQSLTMWHWLTLAVVLLGLELLTGTTYLLWPFVAAIIVGLGLASPIPFGWEVQLVTFAAVTGVLTLAGDKFVAKRWLKSDQPKLNVRVEQLLGEKVIAAAAFVAGEGRVRLGDSVWSAEVDGAETVGEGAVLEVVGVEGATLKVRALGGASSS